VAFTAGQLPSAAQPAARSRSWVRADPSYALGKNAAPAALEIETSFQRLDGGYAAVQTLKTKIKSL